MRNGVKCYMENPCSSSGQTGMSVLPSTYKLITTAVHSKYETRLLRIGFQLLPEVNNVCVHCARVWIILVTPDRVQQTIAAERFHGMSDEISQQCKLLCRKFDRQAGASHFIAADVHFDIAELINLHR